MSNNSLSQPLNRLNVFLGAGFSHEKYLIDFLMFGDRKLLYLININKNNNLVRAQKGEVGDEALH